MKEYKLSFRSWKDCVCNIKLNFENTETKEYVYYNICMTTTPADPYPVTELSGPVREMITNQIHVTNPLKTAVNIKSDQIVKDNDYVLIKPDSLILIPDSEVPLEISYRPLLTNTTLNSLITIKSPELGDLKYPLQLKGTSGQPPKVLPPMVASLGSEKIVTYNFLSYIKKATEFQIKIEKFNDSFPNISEFTPVFDESAKQSGPPVIKRTEPCDYIKGTDITGNIKFEPCNFTGESKAMLRVVSAEAGEYLFVLVGQSSAPKASVSRYINNLGSSQNTSWKGIQPRV
ncbi:MAG: hypothetical protein GY861_04940 [bacterium]|nr:hypothetical protein [bacterium]